ncbi:MAG TPA: OmpA family protein [Burkholderiales bacterium]|nr:OmpA family protein [Burkholderiales bacterium]
MKAQKLVFIVAALAFLGACVTEPEKPAPAPAAKPAPTPPPEPRAVPAPPPPQAAKPQPEAPKKPAIVNLASTELFEFNKAVLTPAARKALDTEVVAKLGDLRDVRYIIVNGHADRLGSVQYNQKLSEKRAEAVRAYLVSRGVAADKVETLGFGKTLPVKACPDQKERKGLIECLAPNRRVVVEVQGTPR